MVDEALDQRDLVERHAHAGPVQGVEHAVAEAAHRGRLLGGDHQPLPGRVLRDERLVHRLGPARVDDGGRQPVGMQLIGHGEQTLDDRPDADEQEVGAGAQHLAAPDRQRFTDTVVEVFAGVARVEQRHRPGVVEGGDDEVAQLLLVLGRTDDEVRQRPQGRQHEHPLVRGAVLADEAGSVQAQQDRRLVLAHVVDEAVERPLRERRVQGHDRAQAGQGHPGRQGHRVLFGDPHIMEAGRKVVAEALQAGPGRHAGGDGGDARIGLGQAHKLLDEGLGVRLRLALRGGLGRERLLGRIDQAQVDGRQGRAVEAHRVLLGRRVAPSLERLHVDDHRSVQLEGRLEGLLELRQVVPVQHADVRQADVLEEADLGPRALEALLGPGERAECRLADERNPGQRPLGGGLRLLVGAREAQLVQPGREAADGRADAHLVVVEHDEHRVLHVAEVVESLEREPGAHGRVANAHGDPLTPRRIVGRLHVACHRQTDADADPRPGMAAVEHVVLALTPAREAADTPDLAQRVEALPSVREQLVRVRLMAGVPHDPVVRRLHDAVERQGQLDGPERAREMPAGLVHGADHLLAQLAGEGLELLRCHVPDLRRLPDRLEQSQAKVSP